MVTTVHTQPGEQIALHQLCWVAPLTILAASAANMIIRLIAVAVFALLRRFSERPLTLFSQVALVVLILSFLPDVAMLLTGFNPGTTLANALVLMLLRVVAWAISVGLLTRLAGA